MNLGPLTRRCVLRAGLCLDACGEKCYHSGTFDVTLFVVTRGGAVAARQAHNLEVGGSNPPPATREVEKFFLHFVVL